MARLLLLTPTELTRDPRARRAAIAARKGGLDVAGVCGRVSAAEPDPLDGVYVVRVGHPGRVDSLHESGLRRRATEPAPKRELRGLYRLVRLAARTIGLYRGGRQLERADVVHANDLDTLPAGWLLSRRWRSRLVYDAHELYSEFDEEPPRLYRRLALALERLLARRSDAVITVSPALADELEQRLRLRRPPFIVLNAPELVDAEPPAVEATGPLRAIYQGSLGTGRPFTDLLDAAALAPGALLTVRILRVATDALRAEVDARGLAERVTVAPPVAAAEVVTALHGYDVGIMFDRPVTRNGELMLPNKLFEYLMAGLAVVAPALPGLAPLLEREGVGVTFEPGRPDRLATVLEDLASDREHVVAMQGRARALAVSKLNAETQAETLTRAWAL